MNVIDISIRKVLPNPEQPRKDFGKDELAGLSASIRENGVIQPIIVEKSGDNYVLHDGERRLRAAKSAGLKMIPAVVVENSNRENLLIRALVANLQRQDLNPVEEALGYKTMLENGLSRNDIALKLGISHARVASRLDILELEPSIQELIAQGKFSRDQRAVDALKSIPGAENRIALARKISENPGLTIKAIVSACERYRDSLEEQERPIQKTDIPGVEIAHRRRGQHNETVWNALQQVGKLPPWLLVEISARKVCDGCGLRDIASETTCKNCAMVDLLVEMIGKTK